MIIQAQARMSLPPELVTEAEGFFAGVLHQIHGLLPIARELIGAAMQNREQCNQFGFKGSLLPICASCRRRPCNYRLPSPARIQNQAGHDDPSLSSASEFPIGWTIGNQAPITSLREEVMSVLFQ
jgi:hypothetical protein